MAAPISAKASLRLGGALRQADLSEDHLPRQGGRRHHHQHRCGAEGGLRARRCEHRSCCSAARLAPSGGSSQSVSPEVLTPQTGATAGSSAIAGADLHEMCGAPIPSSCRSPDKASPSHLARFAQTDLARPLLSQCGLLRVSDRKPAADTIPLQTCSRRRACRSATICRAGSLAHGRYCVCVSPIVDDATNHPTRLSGPMAGRSCLDCKMPCPRRSTKVCAV